MTVRLICIALWLALVALALVAIPAHAGDLKVSVCARLPLPGPDHVINPNDPPKRQVRETVLACERVTVPDPRHVFGRFDPVTDFKRDPRSFA